MIIMCVINPYNLNNNNIVDCIMLLCSINLIILLYLTINSIIIVNTYSIVNTPSTVNTSIDTIIHSIRTLIMDELVSNSLVN
jgi:hypothetical protein